MRILGIDICKGSCVAYLLDTATTDPTEPRKLLYKGNWHYASANIYGLRTILDLTADVAIVEPTGVNYSRLWVTHLIRQGVQVKMVSHNRLARYRQHLDLPDKSDESDSLALAMYGYEYRDQPHRFLGERDQTTALIRQKVLRLGHYARVQSPIINRIRQDLAWQFPEIAQTNGMTAWHWLAGTKQSDKYDKKHAETVGLGITHETRSHAKRLVELWKDEDLLERELADLMAKDPRFTPYRQVLTAWGMGVRCQAAIISQIYPLSSFLDDNGKPLVVWGKSRKHKDKRTKRHLGLRRFCKASGLAPTEKSSGDKESKQIVGGSDVCRRYIWLWA